MRDVERVIRTRGDREPGHIGGVEDSGRDLADAAAERRLQLAVDDHRRGNEALVRRAGTGRRVEGERRSGGDQLAVDEVGDQLDVVNAVRDAAEERLVAADDAGDPHRARLGRRARGLHDRFLDVRDAPDPPLGRGENGGSRPGHVDGDAGLGGRDPHVRAVDDEARVAGGLGQLAVEPREVRVRSVTPENDLSEAVGRQHQHPRQQPA